MAHPAAGQDLQAPTAHPHPEGEFWRDKGSIRPHSDGVPDINGKTSLYTPFTQPHSTHTPLIPSFHSHHTPPTLTDSSRHTLTAQYSHMGPERLLGDTEDAMRLQEEEEETNGMAASIMSGLLLERLVHMELETWQLSHWP